MAKENNLVSKYITVKGRTHIKGWQSCGRTETCTDVIGRSTMNLLRSTSRQCYKAGGAQVQWVKV